MVAAFEQLARERQAGTVTAEFLGRLEVVLAVGAVREPRVLGCLVQRPAQRRRALAGEMPGRAVTVGLVDGDVHAAIANRVTAVLKAPAVAELGDDRDRDQLPDPVVALDQRFAASLPARVRTQLRIQRGDLALERVDHRKRDRDLLSCGFG